MDNDTLVPQSAVIAYRRQLWRLKVLLVTSLNTQRWVLPKGHIDPGLSPHESAAKEALEEAGVVGTVWRRSLGTYDYAKSGRKGGGRRRVEVFPMAVTEVLHFWPEQHQRRRRWMTVEDAVEAVAEPQLKMLLRAFEAEMKDGRAAAAAVRPLQRKRRR